jgi:MFS family permease
MALAPGTRFESDIPARLDRLPWSRWHWRVVIALGITWMLDGLETTLVGAIGPVLMRPDTLGLTSTQLGGTATAYLAGAVLGALLFGRLTDLWGRKRLFLVTLTVYLLATLASFYGVAPDRISLYLLPFAFSNLMGPLVLGHLFDKVGRRKMIALTYATSGVLILLAGGGFAAGWLTAVTQTVAWTAVFFVASSAASSAYLTVSELFPVELRGMAIALFYAAGTSIGGVAAPALFGALLETGSRGWIFVGYAIGAVLMLAAGGVAAVLGVAAERRSLEAVNEAPDVAGRQGT